MKMGWAEWVHIKLSETPRVVTPHQWHMLVWIEAKVGGNYALKSPRDVCDTAVAKCYEDPLVEKRVLEAGIGAVAKGETAPFSV